MVKLKQLIFDADDTLWENNKFFIDTTESFIELCTQKGYKRNYITNLFNEIEIKSVAEMGYGSETFIRILEDLFSRLSRKNHLDIDTYNNIINKFKIHTKNKPPLFPGVATILQSLIQIYDLYILTKGNISEQQEKINRSGLKQYFKKEFVVPEKNDEIFLSIIKDNKWIAGECCMIGNSPKSDINPALRCGMYAIFIPYDFTWHLDNEDVMQNNGKLKTAKDFTEIPQILNEFT